MSAFDTLLSIADRQNLVKLDLRLCLVDAAKIPYRIDGDCAKTNTLTDFSTLDEVLALDPRVLEKYKGIGCSIQASGISAIDVDHCFSVPFDLSSGDQRAVDICKIFLEDGYIEFSFSGTGLRILLPNYHIDSSEFYTKNSKQKIEFYQPSGSFRYVTITGQTICDNQVTATDQGRQHLISFLNQYMLKPTKTTRTVEIDQTDAFDIDSLMVDVKRLYYQNPQFQDLWFGKAPGSGRDESERDFKLVGMLFDYITTNKQAIKHLFESSPYFQTKDFRHIQKWNRNDFWYYNYMFDKIKQEGT